MHTKSVLIGLAGFAGLLLTAAVYWAGLSGPFLLDDNPNIVQVMPDEKSWDAFVYMVTHNGSGITSIMSRAVSVLSFFLTALEYHLDPWGYKYHNLLLHLLNGVLLFRFMQVVLPRLDRELDERRVLLIAGLTTALWLLHPLFVSTVLYVVQRMTQLAACFMLLALLAYLKARTVDDNRAQFYLFGWLLMPLMVLLAVMSKEIGALLPLYFLILELCVFRTTRASLRGNARLTLFLGLSIVLPIVAGAALLVLRLESLTDYGGRTFTLGERLLTELHVLVFYLRLILLPRIREMSLFHDDFPVTTGLDAITLLLICLLLGALVVAWRLRNSWPLVSFAVTWFLVSHLLESTFVPLELVFEHRNYFAAVGVLLLPVWAVFRFVPLKPFRYAVPLLCGIFAFMTATRAAEWGDYDLFNRVAVEEHPRSTRALNFYVNYLTQAGDYREAIRRLEQLQELAPRDSGASVHLLALGCVTGMRNAVTLETARQRIGAYPVSVYAQNGLQNLVMLTVANKCPVLESADLKSLLDVGIEAEGARGVIRTRGYLQRLRGIVALSEGRYSQGYSDFRIAHEDTGNVSLLVELLEHQVKISRIEDARETLALIEQENRELLGIEQYQVNKALKILAAAE